MERISSAIANRSKRGFTLVEILIVAPVLLLLIGFMGSVLISMYGSVVVESHKVLLRAEAQKLATSLKSDLADATAFSAAPDASVFDAHEPDSGWIFNTQPPTLIAKEFAFSRSSNPADAQIVRREPGCSDAAVVNRIYFTEPTSGTDFRTLYRRTLVPNSDTLCGSIQAYPTCPSSAEDQQCARDEILNERIADMSITYLDENGATIDVYNAENTAVPDLARAIKIDITIGEIAYGKSIKESATIMVEHNGR